MLLQDLSSLEHTENHPSHFLDYIHKQNNIKLYNMMLTPFLKMECQVTSK